MDFVEDVRPRHDGGALDVQISAPVLGMITVAEYVRSVGSGLQLINECQAIGARPVIAEFGAETRRHKIYPRSHGT